MNKLVRFEIALSALISYCENLAGRGQLSHDEEAEMYRLLALVRRAVNAETKTNAQGGP